MEIKTKSQASIALEQAMVHLERVQHVLATLRRSAADKLQEARRTSENDLRKLLANSLDAIVFANGQIAKFRRPLFIALKELAVLSQRAQKTLTRLARNVIDKPLRLEEARRTSENDLRKLLANSLDAIVVTDGDHRLVCANPKALDLFGVSELNMRKFTIDAFLSHCQILELRRKWFVIRRDERYGKCKIRRLDGSLRIAEYICVANFISRQDLYRFQNVALPGITQFRLSAKMPISHTEDSRKSISAANVTKQFKPKPWAELSFADSSGNAAMNQKFSMERAQNVIAFLLQDCNVPVRHIVVAPGATGVAAPVASKRDRSLTRRKPPR
jgi:PAS domain S-box-containing protein